MAEIVIMPKQGQSVESCVITEWHKKTGDAVKPGDVLFTYETDKATFEEEAKIEGTLLAILAREGEDIPCLDAVCVIGSEGEDIGALLAERSGGKAAAVTPAEADAKTEAAGIHAQPAPRSDGRVFASPRAKAAAERQGVDAADAVPTGPNGRVIERDIYALSAQAESSVRAAQTERAAETAEDAYADQPLSNVRKVIAKTMHLSLSAMAQLTHHASFDATRLLALRQRFKESGGEYGDITLNDMILYAVSRTLKNHPPLNAHFLDDKMRFFRIVNLGIAVDTERGLLVPTLFNADFRSLRQISQDAKQLIKMAQSGSISPELLTGGTFTVTNLGSLGVESFTPVINPPQTAILGVCAIVSRIKASGDVYPAMGLSLTYDHRATDGAPASRFLKELCANLENFDLLLVG